MCGVLPLPCMTSCGFGYCLDVWGTSKGSRYVCFWGVSDDWWTAARLDFTRPAVFPPLFAVTLSLTGQSLLSVDRVTLVRVSGGANCVANGGTGLPTTTGVRKKTCFFLPPSSHSSCMFLFILLPSRIVKVLPAVSPPLPPPLSSPSPLHLLGSGTSASPEHYSNHHWGWSPHCPRPVQGVCASW